jgi:hypothetical protein
MTRHSNLSNEKQRLRYFLWQMIKKYEPTCYLCHKPFKYEDALPARGTDNLTEHHKNGIHNTDLSNVVMVHRYCHKAYHTKDNINR